MEPVGPGQRDDGRSVVDVTPGQQQRGEAGEDGADDGRAQPAEHLATVPSTPARGPRVLPGRAAHPCAAAVVPSGCPAQTSRCSVGQHEYDRDGELHDHPQHPVARCPLREAGPEWGDRFRDSHGRPSGAARDAGRQQHAPDVRGQRGLALVGRIHPVDADQARVVPTEPALTERVREGGVQLPGKIAEPAVDRRDETGRRRVRWPTGWSSALRRPQGGARAQAWVDRIRGSPDCQTASFMSNACVIRLTAARRPGWFSGTFSRGAVGRASSARSNSVTERRIGTVAHS